MTRPGHDIAWTGHDESDDADRFASLREVLSTEYVDLPNDQLALVLDGIYGEGTADDLESFWNTLKSVGKTVGGVAKQALPGVIQGATAGMALGPVGMVAGALGGGALSAASGALGRSSSPTARGIGGALGAAGQVLGRGGGVGGMLGAAGSLAAGAGGAARSLGRVRGQISRLAASHGVPVPNVPLPLGGSPAAGQLLSLLSRPEIGRALMSMIMGPAGRRNISVGGVPVPTGAITNLLGVLANQAAAEFHASTSGEAIGVPAYLQDQAGEFVCDPANPVERAQVLLELFEDVDETAPVAHESDDEDWDEDDERAWRESRVSALYDQIELAEIYASGELED